MSERVTLVLALALSAGCTTGELAPDSGRAWLAPQGGCGREYVIDGRFGAMDDPACAEWQAQPLRGRFGDLYVDVDQESNLMVLNDWHLRDDAPATAGMYNLFCLATELGVFEIRVFGDQHVEAWLDGESIDDQVEGASGFGSSPLTATPHSIFEFRLATLPTEILVMECDPAGGTMEVPAPPPDVTLASDGSCFPGSAPAVPHNLVREPTIFDIQLGAEGVRRATTTTAPILLGVDARAVEPGADLTLYGAQLGTWGTVRIGEALVEPSAWTDSSVTVRVPDDVAGRLELSVSADGVVSNALSLAVRVAGCAPSCGECGDDGCGGSCGDCEPGYECDPESQACVPQPLD